MGVRDAVCDRRSSLNIINGYVGGGGGEIENRRFGGLSEIDRASSICYEGRVGA